MGVPTSEVGYTSAMPRREDHEVHKDMWGIGGGEKYIYYLCTYIIYIFFAKLREPMLVSSRVSVGPSLRPHGKTRAPMDGFSWNLILEYFSKKSVEEIQVSLKSDKNNQLTLLIISRSFLLRMRKITDKDCREYQNIHFRFNNIFENRSVSEIIWKNILWSQTGHSSQYGACVLHVG